MTAKPKDCPNEERIILLERQVSALSAELSLLQAQMRLNQGRTTADPPQNALSITAAQSKAKKAVEAVRKAQFDEMEREVARQKIVQEEERLQRRVRELDVEARLFIRERTHGSPKTMTRKELQTAFEEHAGMMYPASRFKQLWAEEAPANWRRPHKGK